MAHTATIICVRFTELHERDQIKPLSEPGEIDEGRNQGADPFFQLIYSEVERFDGIVAELVRDELVARFPTASDAVLAAKAMQQVASRAVRTDVTAPGALHIGVHVGEGNEENAASFDSATDVARHLSEIAAAGQVLTSNIVRLLVGDQSDLEFSPFESFGNDGVETDDGLADTWQVVLQPLIDERATRVIVADDAALIRVGVVHLLEGEGFTVVAEAADYAGLIAAIDRDLPDLVITDIRMPPTQRDEGLQAAAYVKEHHPEMAVLILSQYIEASAAAALFDGQTAGIGYLLKERVGELDEFVEATRRVAAGESIVDPLVTDQLVSQQRGTQGPVASLSEREREVLALIAQGLSNQAVRARLFLSAKTVESHVRSIFLKLGLPEDTDGNRRVQAVIRWLQADRG